MNPDEMDLGEPVEGNPQGGSDDAEEYADVGDFISGGLQVERGEEEAGKETPTIEKHTGD